MAKPLHLHLLHHLRRYTSTYACPTTPFCLLSLHSRSPDLICPKLLSTATRYPLQYDMIISRPVNPPSPVSSRRRTPPVKSQSQDSNPDSDVSFDEWVDKKLSGKDTDGKEVIMDKSKRKYYNKRRKRMYGESESDDESGRRGNESEFIELKQEVVEPRTLFHREQELYFYDTFAYPWEKNKHYKMVYQLEKKYFPDQGFDKAFLPPGESNAKRGKKELGNKGVEAAGEDDRLVFFDENEKEVKDGKAGDVTEKKVEEFFKCLKKFPNEKDGDVAVAEPFLSTRSAGLPPKWDGPNGTVVLVNKPKGEFFFPNNFCRTFRILVL